MTFEADETSDIRLSRGRDIRGTEKLLALMYTWHPAGDPHATAKPCPPVMRAAVQPVVATLLVKAKEQQQKKIIAPPIVPSLRRKYETTKFPLGMPLARRIINVIAEEFSMPPDDLVSGRREKRYVVARYAAVWLFMKATPFSFPAIGRQLGGRDHTTILHARDRAKLLFAEEAFCKRFDQLKLMVMR